MVESSHLPPMTRYLERYLDARKASNACVERMPGECVYIYYQLLRHGKAGKGRLKA
jgi:hypothetical protein